MFTSQRWSEGTIEQSKKGLGLSFGNSSTVLFKSHLKHRTREVEGILKVTEPPHFPDEETNRGPGTHLVSQIVREAPIVESMTPKSVLALLLAPPPTDCLFPEA